MPTVAGLKRRAYAHIRSKLVRGDFSPGRGLSNRALARELGISPVPIREAICQLEAEGVLEQRPQSGTYPRVLSRQEWLHLFELREVLEGNAAYHAAARVTPRQLARMQKACDRFQRIIDRVVAGKYATYEGPLAAQLSECELPFHTTILEAAGNPIAMRIIDQFQVISIALEAMRRLIAPMGPELIERLEENQREHLAILRALKAGDGDAARAAVIRHFTSGRRWILIDVERSKTK
jgi:DNA-binding GntR family transcriptional regulator